MTGDTAGSEVSDVTSQQNHSSVPSAQPAKEKESLKPAQSVPPTVQAAGGQQTGAPLTAAEKKARREALRALMFNNKEGEFVARLPGQLNGSQFQVQKSNNSQLYLHDFVSATTVD